MALRVRLYDFNNENAIILKYNARYYTFTYYIV
jgi:hypothetical protein